MLRKQMLIDSGGPGRRRGGLGQEFVLQSHARNPITLSIRPDLIKFPAPGLNGGHPGRLGEVFLNGERVERFPPMEIQPGDTAVLRVPGGGGYGDPKTRERDRVRQDVALGIVSPEAARALYGLTD
jgi:N-methylhydantoinase B